EVMSPALQSQLDFGPPMSADAYLDYCRAAFSALHGKSDRLNFMLAPSAPQRCSPDLLQACHELSVKMHVPFHTHVLETKTQAVTGFELYGKSLIAYMSDLGVLTRNTTVAHSVWVSPHDIELMGAARCSVAHNAISNQKLGAGIAPIRQLMDAGVTIALGTDGVSSNDTARIFDVMRVAGLIHSVSGPDYKQWISADEILKMATINGARSAMLEDVAGSLAVGKAADLLILDLTTSSFLPLNDMAKHLVYAENGSSIETVMVAGEIVVHQGKMCSIDEEDIVAEIRERVPAHLSQHSTLEQRNAVFHSAMAEIHRRATSKDIGINRYIGTTNMMAS
ncbi:amidohydrolase, partial [Salmonella enterica subsp. enterica serovar Alachua]|nr:amidohydrolase [Salmonella enterica subsp. enterica serovar Alachua]